MDDAIVLEKRIAEIRAAMAKQATLLLDEQIMQGVSTTDKAVHLSDERGWRHSGCTPKEFYNDNR